ncbi:MAG TPA: hypothetical protein VN915_05535 [Elusimicrobiota bacterium]|nr:hypothetical protein [Elusimicrobiota bacterium]
MTNPARLAVLLVLAAAAPRARADGEIGLHAGKLSLALGRAASGTGASTVSGAAYGVDYIHQAGINVGLGLSLDYLKPADKTSGSLIKNAQASTSIDSASFLGVIRVGSTEDAFQPNVVFGLGVHYTSLKVDAAPQTGFGWKDTGTNERRTLVDGAGWGPAIKFQGGADYALTDNFIAGAFLAINYLGTASYQATDQAKSLGVNSVSGSMIGITFGVNAIARF